MNIEELAFKNIEELEPEDELILYDIIDFLQKDRKQWINQYTQAHNDYVNLQQENTELKEKINLRNKEKTDICNKLVNYREKIKRLKKEITNLISINKQSKAELKRCVKANVILDDETTELTEKLSVVNQMNETNYNNYCKELKVNAKLKEEIKAYQTMYFDKVMIINKAIEYIEKETQYDEEHKYYDVDVEDILKILEILKEDNKEEK